MQLSVHSATNEGNFSSWPCYVFNSSYWNPLASQLNTQPTDWEGESPRVSVYHTLLPCQIFHICLLGPVFYDICLMHTTNKSY